MGGLTRWDPTHWDPFRDIEEIGERFNRILQKLPARHGDGGKEALTIADWSPTVDISEDDKEYLIKAEIPGVEKENIKLNVQDGVLTIKGERKQEREQKGKKYHRVERSYGTFWRSFTLPDGVAEDQLKADFKDGILFVHLPKREESKPKSVEVKVN